MSRIWLFLSRIPIWAWLLLYAVIASAIIMRFHPSDALVSFDEGFHGGAALFFREAVRYLLHIGDGVRPTYLIGEFSNGVTLYPPLWTFVAGTVSFIFGRSVDAFRLGTILFYIATILFTYWFVRKSLKQEMAAVFAALLLSTVPMVVIYSHLMMLEVPLLLGIEFMVAMFFLTATGLIPRTPRTVALIAFGFFCASLTKLAAFPVAWVVNISWMVLASLFFPRSRFYRSFLRWELLLYFLASLGSIVLFVKLEGALLHANTVAFHESQSQLGDSASPLIHALHLVWNNRSFYLRDFYHIRALSWLWAGSVGVYALWKRTPFALCLPVWTLGIYAVFSGVLPQVPQYITSIYAPLAIGLAVVAAEVVQLISKRSLRAVAAIGLITGLCGWQLISLPLSESYDWYGGRNGITQAAGVLAAEAKPYDRVISWNDGGTLAIRLAGFDKKLQIHNGIEQICPDALVDSYEWGLFVNQPPGLSVVDKSVLSPPLWESSRGFDPNNTTVVYHNDGTLWPVVLTPEKIDLKHIEKDPTTETGTAGVFKNTDSQPVVWGCYRIFPYGDFTITIRMRAVGPLTFNPSLPVVTGDYSDYPGGDLKKIEILGSDLTTEYKNFTFQVSRIKYNAQGEIHLLIAQPATIAIEKIVIDQKK